MCGIVGYIGEQQAEPILMYGLKSLEYRGYDSAGIAVFNTDKVEVVKTQGRLANLEEKLVGKSIQGTVGIGHTRWATHGEPSDINSHPHCSGTKSISLVHNGIIENYMALKEELEEKGYHFASDTDTEVAVQLIDYYYQESKDLLDAVLKTMKKIKGSYAFGVLSQEQPDQLIAARKDSPLILGIGKGENFIASDIPAILKHTRNMYLLEEEEVAVVTKDNIIIYDIDKNEIHKEIFEVKWDVKAAEKGGYPHFMLKEIYEQPKVIKDTLSPRISMEENVIQLDDIEFTENELKSINKIYIIACGTASYAAQVGKYLIERVAKIPVVAEAASEFRYREPLIDENTMMIVISQSGETADTLAALRLGKKAGAKVIGIVNVVGSSIARESDDVLYTWAGPEIAVASTKAYSTQLIAMYLIAIKIAMLRGAVDENEFITLRNELYELPDKVDLILKQNDQIKTYADQYIRSKNVFYVGRGLDFATCLEGSLKLKEIAYLHSEPYAAGELKHGPIALIEDGTLVVGVVAQEELLEKTISNLKEVKARGASILVIAQEGNKEILDVADDVIYIPRTHWMFTTLLANIPQQLLAYYIAVGLGNDVDKPRNLAKSVTVE